MKKIDYNGQLLCEYQAKLFEKSYELNYSSSKFIAKFLKTDLNRILDEGYSVFLPLDVNEGIDEIRSKRVRFMDKKDKYSKDSLFWMGYMYRYICYTREQSLSFVMKLFKHQQMNSVYYDYHTQDPEWCISNLLELNGLDENIFDNNYRLKKIMKERGFLG